MPSSFKVTKLKPTNLMICQFYMKQVERAVPVRLHKYKIKETTKGH